jgi:hypothetical protein
MDSQLHTALYHFIHLSGLGQGLVKMNAGFFLIYVSARPDIDNGPGGSDLGDAAPCYLPLSVKNLHLIAFMQSQNTAQMVVILTLQNHVLFTELLRRGVEFRYCQG